jgi:hypothetical protein
MEIICRYCDIVILKVSVLCSVVKFLKSAKSTEGSSNYVLNDKKG